MLSNKRARFLALSIACLGVSFLIENASEFIDAHSYCYEAGAGPFMTVSYYYHRLTRLGNPHLRNIFTRVIRITPQSGDGNVIHSPCDARRLHARLLLVLANSVRPPAVIVLDYTYRTDTCAPDKPESIALRDALVQATQRVPVVIGLSDLSHSDLPDNVREKSLPHPLTPAEGVLDPQQWRPMPESDRLRYGLVRLHCDLELIPLAWSTYMDLKLTTCKDLPTITQMAATAYDSRAISEELAARSQKGQNALITLLPEIRGYDARDVLGGGQAVLDDLAAHIVIVCDFEGDMIDSPSGPLPGGVFHANYIESVLTNSFTWPAPRIWVLLASFLWFVVIEILFEKLAHSPLKAALYSVFASAAFLVVLYWVIVRLFNYYILAWPPSAAFLIGKTWSAVQARALEARTN
jgi:hypothetical protein